MNLFSKMFTKMKVTVLLGILLMGGVHIRAAMVELHVSLDGSDSYPGTKDKPFQTFERARDEIRSLKESKSLKHGVTVWIAGGIYERNKTFELNELDSGLKDAPIIYRAIEGQPVSISGGRNISDSYVTTVTDQGILDRIIDVDAKTKIRQIKLKALGITDYGKMHARGFRRPYVNAPMELFINGQAYHISRWPNDSLIRIGTVLDQGSVPRDGDYSNRGGKFAYDYDRPEKWKQADDIWLSGYFKWGYADDTIKVYDIDQQKKTFKLAQAHLYGIHGEKSWRAYYALNLVEEIDQPGEYYIDREKGILYFYPKGDLKGSDICVSMLEEPIVAMEGTSYVKFESLTFEVSRGIGIYIERGTSNQIVGCTLRNIGVVAVCIGKGIESDTITRHAFTGKPVSRELGSWHEHIYDNPCFDREGGTNHGVISCDIYNIGAGGISLGGGDRLTLTPADNYVKNCDIHHFNRLSWTCKAGVNIDGVGNRIEHCRIHDCPNSAIYLHGNDHMIEYNEVYNASLHAHDHGFFYLGRDPSEQGNVLRYNFWHHSSIGPDVHFFVVGIYNDDGSCGTKIYGNIFYKAGKDGVVQYGSGQDVDFQNCILVDCPKPITADDHMATWAKRYLKKGALIDQRLALVRHDQPPYSVKYPNLANYWNEELGTPKRNTYKNNVIITQNIDAAREALNTPYVEVENNYLSKDDPGFVDAASMNFQLKADSVVYQELPDFKPIPFDKIGLYLDQWRNALPERTDLVSDETHQINENIYSPPKKQGKYILTPKTGPMPQIHGSSVFGVRPGAPFLYTIPVTGSRPMKYAAEGLPEGLKLNEITGIISGTITERGKRDYRIVFIAKNDKGQARKDFKIIVGDTICLTPPMGWNSWNCWGKAVDQEKVLASAHAMAEKGLINYGWTYINIDDAWQGIRGGKHHAIEPDPEKFPDIEKMCDQIHALGLKVGIYSSPWITTYAGFAGGSSDNPDGQWTPSESKNRKENWRHGIHHFDIQDSAQWSDWGIDYLKYDWNPNDPDSILRMANALKSCGRDIVYSLSNTAPLEHAELYGQVVNCWRTAGDLKDRWDAKGFHLNIREQWQLHRHWIETGIRGGPGHFPDADMLVVGDVVEYNHRDKPRPSRLTADEQYSHISLWCLWSSPLLIGCPIESMDDFTLNLLTNSEVLAVHQDSIATAGKSVLIEDGVEIIVKSLEDGSKAIGLFNTSDKAQVITLDWKLAGLKGNEMIRDLWRQVDIGLHQDSFSAMVPSHGVILISAK